MGLLVDNFAGGGGASTGFQMAYGRDVDIAVNHDVAAIAMHMANHPGTTHYQEDIWQVDPAAVCHGEPVDVAWFSPDCKHFSKAKGAALVDRKIRGLAWVVLRWAGKVRSKVIIVENVEEFTSWGPMRKGKPVKSKRGQTFQRWVSQLRALGYAVDWRELVAADYGAPTTRRRFYLVARCDGQRIVWPEATHADPGSAEAAAGRKLPWRSAAEIIDWTLPCPSIFATKAEIKDKYGIKAIRPLADNTLKRVARGTDKFTIKADKPFIVGVNHTTRWGNYDFFRGGDIDKPYGTVTARNGSGIVVANMQAIGQTGFLEDRSYPVTDPVRTIVSKAEQCAEKCILAPYHMHNNENAAGTDMRAPLNTARTGGGGGQMLIAPSLIQYHAEKPGEYVRGQRDTNPIMTTDASNRYGLADAYLTEYYGKAQDGLSAAEPLRTVTARDKEGVTVAHIQKYYDGGYTGCGSDPRSPLGTVTAGCDHNALVLAHLAKFKGANLGQSANDPLMTVTAKSGGGSFAVVQTRIVKYAPGADLHRWPEVRELLNRWCGYTLAEDEVLLLHIRGGWYYIADIGLRMLTPRELFNAQGFPADYIIDVDAAGRPYKKSAQVARCGNSVCPPVAAALLLANAPQAGRRGKCA